MDIISEQQLNQILEQKIRSVLKNASKEILEEFKQNYIIPYVYKNHGENKEYEPTMEFENSWEWTNIEKKAGELVSEMWSNPGKMNFNPTAYSDVGEHGSTFGKPNDVRMYMDEILNKDLSSSLHTSVYRPEQYWDEFLSQFVEGGKLQALINKHCLSEGLTPEIFSFR